MSRVRKRRMVEAICEVCAVMSRQEHIDLHRNDLKVAAS